jgi:hypothetical protein
VGRAWPLTGVLPARQELRNFGHLLRHTVACADRSAALLWFNSEAARRAIHAAGVGEIGRWEPCSDVLRYRHDAGGRRRWMPPVPRCAQLAGALSPPPLSPPPSSPPAASPVTRQLPPAPAGSMVEVHRRLQWAGLRALVYSGEPP